MSAFFDIWISSKENAPRYSRTGCENWQQKVTGTWTSKPEIKDKSIIKELSTETHQLIIIGQFYEAVDTGELLKGCISYAEDNNKGFTDPSGHYIIFLIAKTGACYVFTNRFGTYHAYWQQAKNRNVISTYFLGLVKQSENKQPDNEGIAGFLTMGFFPSDKTWLNNIKILEPASCYSFDKDLNLLYKKRYWDWTHKPVQLPVQDYLKNFHNALTASLSYALKDKKVAIPLSGGLDSRTLAGVIANMPDIPATKWAYSYGLKHSSPEIAIARQIATAGNLSFDGYEVPNYLFDRMPLIIDSVELFQYVDGTRQACMKELLEQKADVVTGGHWGDVWFSDMCITMNGETGENALMNAFRKKVVKKGSSKLLSVLADDLIHVQNYAESYFADYISRYSYIRDIDFRFKIFKTDQWSFRWTLASVRMYQAAVMPVLPFYDKHVANTLLQVPTAQLKGRSLQVKYLKQYYPELAKIKWQEYDSNLYNYKWLNNRNLAYRAINKLKRSISPKPQVIRNADLFYRNANGKAKLLEVINDSAVKSMLSAEKSQSLLTDYYNDPGAANTYAVSMLHTFAQFIRTIS